MRILLLGNTGQLGWELNRTLLPLADLTAVDYPTINMAEPEGVLALMRQSKFELVINATAYTNVDGAESEGDLAMAINAVGPGAVAREARSLGIPLIHYSTDYVFDGGKGSPYIETDTPNPLNMYGRSKLSGDEAVMEAHPDYLILRTSWVYSLSRGGFVQKLLGWAAKNPTLTIVDDQIGNPTWARMLAEVTAMLIHRHAESLSEFIHDHTGIYHLAGSGHGSRLDWARAALDATGREEIILKPGKTADFPSPATRPLFSALDCQKFLRTFGIALPDWRVSLPLALEPLRRTDTSA